MAKASSTEVAKKEEKLPVAANVMEMFQQDSGKGVENIGQRDLAMPLISVLQSGSGIVKKSDPKYIDGAQEGQLFNSVTSERYDGDNGITVFPCFFQSVVIEWRPREEGGGLVKIYSMEEAEPIIKTCTRNEKGNFVNAAGNNLVQTAQHYIGFINPNNNDLEFAVLPMTSSQLKKSRRWNSLISGAKIQHGERVFSPPSFGQKFKLRTVVETKSTNTWYGYDIQADGFVDDPVLYAQLKSFYESVSKVPAHSMQATYESQGIHQDEPQSEEALNESLKVI